MSICGEFDGDSEDEDSVDSWGGGVNGEAVTLSGGGALGGALGGGGLCGGAMKIGGTGRGGGARDLATSSEACCSGSGGGRDLATSSEARCGGGGGGVSAFLEAAEQTALIPNDKLGWIGGARGGDDVFTGGGA